MIVGIMAQRNKKRIKTAFVKTNLINYRKCKLVTFILRKNHTFDKHKSINLLDFIR